MPQWDLVDELRVISLDWDCRNLPLRLRSTTDSDYNHSVLRRICHLHPNASYNSSAHSNDFYSQYLTICEDEFYVSSVLKIFEGRITQKEKPVRSRRLQLARYRASGSAPTLSQVLAEKCWRFTKILVVSTSSQVLADECCCSTSKTAGRVLGLC